MKILECSLLLILLGSFRVNVECQAKEQFVTNIFKKSLELLELLSMPVTTGHKEDALPLRYSVGMPSRKHTSQS